MFVQKYMRRLLMMVTIAALFLAGCNVGATPAPTYDISAINTAIVGTTFAQISFQLTQTAQSVPPTFAPAITDTPVTLPTFGQPGDVSPTSAIATISFDTTSVASVTPIPGFTPLASPAAPGATLASGDACNNNVFEGDITVPDGTVYKPGTDFQKIWRIRNTGTCTWDEGYTLVFIAGDRAIDPYNFKIKDKKDFVAPGEAKDIGINLTAPLDEGKYEGHWKMQNDHGYYFGSILSVYITVKKK